MCARIPRLNLTLRASTTGIGNLDKMESMQTIYGFECFSAFLQRKFITKPVFLVAGTGCIVWVCYAANYNYLLRTAVMLRVNVLRQNNIITRRLNLASF